MTESRTLEDVDKIMGYAKLEANEFLPTVQCLRFGPSLDNTSLQLMEVDNALLRALEDGERVVFRGDASDSAVLCSSSTTYQVRAKETSNNLLIVPELQLPEAMDGQENRDIKHCEAVGMMTEYYEVLPVRPRLQRLRAMLSENQFSGVECEEDEEHQGKKFCLADIQARVQASDQELHHGLQALQACCIDGFWRQLDFDFLGKVLENILALCDEQGWQWSSVPGKVACDILQDTFPRNIVFHVLQCFSDRGLRDSCPEDQDFQLSEDKVCRYNAEMLLRHIDKMNLQEFEQSWQLTVPDGMKTGNYQLEGLALMERDSKPHVIRYFPVDTMPEGVEERFQTLFRAKTKWSLQEISPYIKDLATEKVGVGALLTKFTRASMQNGIKVYNSKKPVS